MFLLLRLRLNQAHNRLHARQRRAHFVRHVVQQMALFGHQLLQLLRHFVKLLRQMGNLVVAIIHLLRDTGFQIACCQAVHTHAQQAYRLGDVIGQNIGQQQPHQNNKGENDEFVPNRRQLQTRDKQRAGRPLNLLVIPAADEKQVFLAPAVVFDMCQR